MSFFGWLGSFCLATCGIPQAYKSYKDGYSKGVSTLFIWLWTVGEASFIIYIPNEVGWDWPIMINLFANFIACVIILRFIYFPTREPDLPPV